MGSVIPSVLARDPRFGPLAQLAVEAHQVDLSRLLVYLIDLVQSEALPHLADQFHVLGLEGWNAALTEEARRALIKSAR